jgi:hypothetical protein
VRKPPSFAGATSRIAKARVAQQRGMTPAVRKSGGRSRKSSAPRASIVAQARSAGMRRGIR